MSDHIQIEEMLAARALGGLDDADAAQLERIMQVHGTTCAECRRLKADYEEVAGRLAFALAPDEMPAGMEDRVMERAARPRRRRFGFALRPVAAMAAAAVIAVAGGIGGYLVAPRPAPGVSALASYVSGSGVRLVSLSGTGRGNLSLVYRPGSQEAYVIGSDLEPAPSGMVYELWLFHGTTPIPATTFETSGDVVVARVDKDASTSNLVAITIEKSPGTAVPQHKAIFSAPITA